VIARLKKERDEARSLLAQADRQFPTPNDATANDPVHSNGKRGFTSYHLVDFVVFLYCKALNFG
jgi:pre-mRNA-processing factor 19